MVNHWLRFRIRRKVRDLLNGCDVRVRSIREADLLLQMALPHARKVKGVGPGQRPNFLAFKGKHVDGIYHKDYWLDASTGRIQGHSINNPHANNKHINVKLPDGRKVAIIIERLP